MAKVKEVQENKFSKEALLKSKRFINNRDLLNTLLENDKEYSISEVEEKIKEFLEGVVK